MSSAIRSHTLDTIGKRERVHDVVALFNEFHALALVDVLERIRFRKCELLGKLVHQGYRVFDNV